MPTRRPPAAWREPVRSYAQSIGKLIWAANRAQASFADLFAVLVDPKHFDVGSVIWHSMTSDKGQRIALQALLALRSSPTTRVSRGTRWALSAADKLSEIRNDAAHMATSPTTSATGVTFIPSPIGNTPSRLQRSRDANLSKRFSEAAGDYVQVQQYVHAIFCSLAYPDEQYPLPLRPKLKAVTVDKKARK